MRKSKKNPSIENVQTYRDYKNRYNFLIRAAKKLHFSRRVATAGNDTRKIWSILKDAIKVKKANANIGSLRQNENIIDNYKAKADIFNKMFSQVGANASRNIPKSRKNFSDYLPRDSLGILY